MKLQIENERKGNEERVSEGSMRDEKVKRESV
jgi:hypothetical protein